MSYVAERALSKRMSCHRWEAHWWGSASLKTLNAFSRLPFPLHHNNKLSDAQTAQLCYSERRNRISLLRLQQTNCLTSFTLILFHQILLVTLRKFWPPLFEAIQSQTNESLTDAAWFARLYLQHSLPTIMDTLWGDWKITMVEGQLHSKIIIIDNPVFRSVWWGNSKVKSNNFRWLNTMKETKILFFVTRQQWRKVSHCPRS